MATINKATFSDFVKSLKINIIICIFFIIFSIVLLNKTDLDLLALILILLGITILIIPIINISLTILNNGNIYYVVKKGTSTIFNTSIKLGLPLDFEYLSENAKKQFIKDYSNGKYNSLQNVQNNSNQNNTYTPNTNPNTNFIKYIGFLPFFMFPIIFIIFIVTQMSQFDFGFGGPIMMLSMVFPFISFSVIMFIVRKQMNNEKIKNIKAESKNNYTYVDKTEISKNDNYTTDDNSTNEMDDDPFAKYDK